MYRCTAAKSYQFSKSEGKSGNNNVIDEATTQHQIRKWLKSKINNNTRRTVHSSLDTSESNSVSPWHKYVNIE